MHDAQEVDTLQPYLAQANGHLVNCFASIMKCNMCDEVASFRARRVNCPFIWWCQSCYDAHQHKDLPHDIEWPIMCHHCNDLPATCRAKSVLNPNWLYWCYHCFERHPHQEPLEDMTYVDLESASEEDVANDGELDGDHEDEHDVHAAEGDGGTQRCSSFNSWHQPLSCNLQALELQSHADTMSIASSQEFALAYQVVDKDDIASISSFQMVPTTAPSVADPDEQQEQQQQQDQQQQQQDAHDLHQLAQEPVMGADCESNVGDVGSNVGSNVGNADPEDHQPDAQGIDKDKHNMASEFAKWREEQELLIAIEMSLHEQDVHQGKNQLAPVADSSSSSKSSSSNSSSSNNMPTLLGKQKKTSKKPRWPLSDYVIGKQDNEKALKDFKVKGQQHVKEHAKVGRTGLEAIPEVHVDEAMHVLEYVDSSGCSQIVFTDERIQQCSQVPMCPIHLLDYKPNCRECANHKFLKEKHTHDVELAKAIEYSLDSSSIIYIDSLPCCSKHTTNMMQWCQTCNQAFELREQFSQA